MATQQERLASLESKVDDIKDDVAEIKTYLQNLDTRFASKLTERIVYTLCGLILVAVITALVALVIWRPTGSTTNLHVSSTKSTTMPTTDKTNVVLVPSQPTATPTPVAPPSPSPQQSLLGIVPSL